MATLSPFLIPASSDVCSSDLFQQDVELLYPPCDVFEVKGMSVVIREGGEVPMFLHASLYKAQETIIHSDIILKRTGISVRMLQR